MRCQVTCSFLLPMLLLSLSTSAKAGDSLSYPELSVAPRASDRLATEASYESKNRWFTHAPIQVSAASTLMAGLLSLDDPSNVALESGEEAPAYWAGLTGVAVGGGWLALTGLLSWSYTPYRSGLDSIKTMPKGTALEQLSRERAAEEQINETAALGTRLTYISLLTNLLASGYIVGSTPDSTTRVVGGIAAVLSTAPVIFSYRWNHVAATQQDYKKRIYGPVSSLGLMRGQNGLAPAIQLSWNL